MMTLLSAPASPFGRKVKIAAIVKGVMDRIEVEKIDTSLPSNPALQTRNPLQKIPVLVLEDGTELYDSRVIVEYLDHLRPSPLLVPTQGMQRVHVLRMAALADGIMEAALLVVYETRFRPEDRRSDAWLARQQSKIDLALGLLETNPPARTTPPDLGQIGIACALGYLDFRHAGRWRAAHPRLVAWLDRFAAEVPAFGATAPS